MSPNAQKILEEARQLPPDEKEWLAESLLIDGIEDVDPEWAAEVERRVADANSPNATTVSWDELEARLRSRLAS